MRRFLVCLFSAVLILCITAPASAGTEWTTMEETASVTYQVDKQTAVFTGEDGNRTLDVWVKVIEKAKPDSYGLVHFLIREKDFTYMKKEHTLYATSGAVTGSSDSSAKGWGPLPAESPVGRIAKRLFADSKTAAATAPPPAAQPPSPVIIISQQEVKQALDEGNIKEKTNKDGTKSYFVRDRKTPALFSGDPESVTNEFNLNSVANSRSATLYFVLEDNRSGSHAIKETVTVVVDGRQWVLRPPLSSNSGGYGGVSFQMLFAMPWPLVDALTATKNPVTVRWEHRYGNNWEVRERVIPDKVMHNVQLMYLGLK